MRQGEWDAQLSLGGSGIYRMGEENGLISQGKSLRNPRICTLFTRYTSPRGSQELVPTPGVEGRKNSRDEYLVDESSSQPNILWSPERCFQKFDAKIQNQLKATMRRCKNMHWVTHLSTRLAGVHQGPSGLGNSRKSDPSIPRTLWGQ